ncbi:TPA: molybdopterin-synthase adenylyltransferase MoeB [Salmonella enterica subsp. diarizonae serovar 61:l,v:z35]|nr:molybdopterin-synthase adenylyltransferase MoeB [Salmonella enterica subsp. enterica serovar Newport]HCT3090240.1 molybdopterin-synthase adenylyltransferase MoeB [Salmonella enterica subsp. diarizonae serovar 61:l,v:z35]HCT3101008.1 molybdopterin-synthase adenylyltransferase MoeB [Salmonella enterica subsp. diarizonae serovar 61:l,v:z35]
MKLPPLVSPVDTLSRDEIVRYSRHLLIPDIGMEGQRRLKNSRVLVIGAGGLGSPVLLYLAAAGVGTIGIVDFDRVDDSNLQRQVIHNITTVGQLKVDSAKATLQRLNAFVTVNTYTEQLGSENAVALFSKYDLILDCTDNFSSRYLINDACVLADKPYVYGAVFALEGQVSVFWENAPNGAGVNYRDLYPEPPPPELAPSCAIGGILGVICVSIGAVMVTEAVKLLIGLGDSLLGRLMIFDAMEMTYRQKSVRKLPKRQTITTLIDYQTLCGLQRNTVDKFEFAPCFITPQQLRDLENTDAVLIDIREKTEWDIVKIPTAIHMPKTPELAQHIKKRFGDDRRLVLCCKDGSRSDVLLAELQQLGVKQVQKLQGGIIRWIREIDPSQPTY